MRGNVKEKGLTPISASSLTDSSIVTLWDGLAILVEIAAERPARPAPIIMTWMESKSESDILLWRKRQKKGARPDAD